MAGKNIWISLMTIAAGAILSALSACNNERNVNSGNLVTVNGSVFVSRLQRVGVADVTVFIEKAPESGSPGIIPDITVRTDENGRWEAKFTLSYPDGGGVFDITPLYVEENMRILMISPESRFLDLGTGFTFQVGKTYNIWDVFLEDFTRADTTG